MSKLSFRARALDAAKPLPIYRGKDMPDLNDCVSINRAVPQMPTGMEKEEESVGTRVFITPPSLLPPPLCQSGLAIHSALYARWRAPLLLQRMRPYAGGVA